MSLAWGMILEITGFHMADTLEEIIIWMGKRVAKLAWGTHQQCYMEYEYVWPILLGRCECKCLYSPLWVLGSKGDSRCSK